MRPAIDLIRHVLGPDCPSDEHALVWLEQALERDSEPLHFLASHFRISEALVYEKAAQWAGLMYSPQIPPQIPASVDIERIDALAEVKSLRTEVGGRDLLFTSPGLFQIVRIKEQLLTRPELAQRICLVPPAALRSGLSDRCAHLMLAESRGRLARLWPYASAHLDLTMGVRIGFALTLALLVILAALTPVILQPVLVPLMAFLLLVPAGLRLAAAFNSVHAGEDPPTLPVPTEDLPVYTILIALRDEANMVPQLIAAMRRLDYPPDKLDIKFVVESVSRSTLEGVARELDDPRFELVIVPEADPATKPKALNYALPLVRGEFLVIYDAEDIPQTDQLRRAVSIFASHPGLDCIQAELVIDNAAENGLTALFAGEYSGQFGLLLPALARWKMPLPLGGTSNHFRVQSLKEVGGWDAFNVTEDADLGVRLNRLRYRTGAFSSRTYEEAPRQFGPWIRQRTRWMKGWMQTFIVHNAKPRQFLRDIGWRNFLIFQAYVGGMIFSAPLHSVFLLVLTIRLATGTDIGVDRFNPWEMAQIFILVAGYSSAYVISAMGLVRLSLHRFLWWQLLLPLYWILTSWAAMRAVYELIMRPYFWAKTPHGLTRFARGMEK